MAPDTDSPAPTDVGILIVPGFTVLHLDLLTDGFRIADRIAGRRCFRCDVLSTDGSAVEASNGRRVEVAGGLAGTAPYDAVFIVSGYRPEDGLSEAISHWLRRHDRHGAAVGGVDTGGLYLAAAGLGAGRRMAVHWEYEARFRDAYPGTDVTARGTEVDGRLMTSSGGLSVAELMLAAVERFQGPALSARLGEVLYFGGDGGRRGAGPEPDPVKRAEAVMMRNLAAPLSLDAIAAAANCHKRTLARHFETRHGRTPMKHYRELRLEHARALLLQGRLTIKDITAAAGFATPAAFTAAFANRFGQPPQRYAAARKRAATKHQLK